MIRDNTAAGKLNMLIVAQTPYSVDVLVNGREYTYYIDQVHMPAILQQYRHGRHGRALADLRRFSFACVPAGGRGES